MQFYVGLHQPSDAGHFTHCMISINRIRDRVSNLEVGEWMLDSGAFTELRDYGRYRHSPAEYAEHIARWASCGELVSASAQDYMCEDIIIHGGWAGGRRFVGTHLSKADHQRLTIARYDELHYYTRNTGVYILPVLQGYAPEEYVSHIRQYGRRLAHGMWVGVGSVCKRNGDPDAIAEVLLAIKKERPDLKLHGFGLKKTALASDLILSLLHTADSMAWSLAARKQGRNGNDWREAERFVERIYTQPIKAHAYQHHFKDAA